MKIKNKCENEDDLHLFLNGPNFTQNRIVIPMLLIKTIFFTCYSPEISFSSQSMDTRALAKVLIFDDTNFSFVGLAE